MATAKSFVGCNSIMKAPKGGENIDNIYAFTNGVHCVTKWELTEEELEEVMRTKSVYLSVLLAGTMPPSYVGSEETVRSMVADVAVWKRDTQ